MNPTLAAMEGGSLQSSLLADAAEVDAQASSGRWPGAGRLFASACALGLLLGVPYMGVGSPQHHGGPLRASPEALDELLAAPQVLLAESTFTPNSPSHPPPLFRVVAKSPYDAGFQHGQLARQRIHGWFASKEMQSIFSWTAGDGATTFAQLKSDNAAEFPAYVEEMQGIADGAGVSMDQVWVANLINDLENLMTITGSPPDHCSDEYAVSHEGYSAGFAHGHNDDWSLVARQFWYFLSVAASADSSGVDSCAGVAYPATLVGWAPSWNAHGMYGTQNTLTPEHSRPGGLGVVFVQKRALCASHSMDETIATLSTPGWSDGASMNLVDVKHQRMVNMEIWEDRHSVLEITPAMGNYSHFNNYKHLLTADGGSVDGGPAKFVHDLRQARVDSLPAPRSAADIAARLGDPGVYNAKGTLVTLVLNGTTGHLNIWCCGVSAAAGNEPVYSWNIRGWFD